MIDLMPNQKPSRVDSRHLRDQARRQFGAKQDGGMMLAGAGRGGVHSCDLPQHRSDRRNWKVKLSRGDWD